MARDKPSPLSTIRKQVAREQRMRASAFAGSAYARFSTGAHAARTGIRTSEYHDGGISAAPTTAVPVRKVVKRIVRRKVLPKNQLRLPTAEGRSEEGSEKAVECWEPAGGHCLFPPDQEEGDEDGSCVLGIARMAEHRLPLLMPALKGLMQDTVPPEKLQTRELPFQEERLVDVFATFRSEVAAMAAKEKLDGEIVAGRKLQVRFAREDDGGNGTVVGPAVWQATKMKDEQI